MRPSPDASPLALTLPSESFAGFASLLQHGMLFPVERPVAMLPFLLTLPGFTADYIEQTVQTIFIDGVAADSLDRELTGGSTLALSAAMPGLAGAIFRRQGVHGSLRSQPGEKKGVAGPVSGFITLKLFNSIAADRIRDLLTLGFLMPGKAVHDFAVMREGLLQPPAVLTLDGRDLACDELLRVVGECPLVAVRAIALPER